MIPIIPPLFIRPNFIKINIASLEKNILNLSPEQINEQVKEIHRLAQQEFFQLSILQKFLKRIQKNKKYYSDPQYKEYYEKFSFIEKKIQRRINFVQHNL